MDQQQIWVSMLIPKETAYQARVKAAILGISRSEFMRQAIVERLRVSEKQREEECHENVTT